MATADAVIGSVAGSDAALVLQDSSGNTFRLIATGGALTPTKNGVGTVGGTVTQATNRTTGVTLNNMSGTITTNNASLAAESAAKFTVTNSYVAVGDVVVVSQQSGSNGGNTSVNVVATAAGSFDIQVSNNNAAAGTAETGAILINFNVIKANGA